MRCFNFDCINILRYARQLFRLDVPRHPSFLHGCGLTDCSLQDYSWEDHGYSLVNRLYPDVGQLLDEKFQIAYNLTYNTMATHRDVDTSMLRRAIWNYIHCMFGIRSAT